MPSFNAAKLVSAFCKMADKTAGLRRWAITRCNAFSRRMPSWALRALRRFHKDRSGINLEAAKLAVVLLPSTARAAVVCVCSSPISWLAATERYPSVTSRASFSIKGSAANVDRGAVGVGDIGSAVVAARLLSPKSTSSRIGSGMPSVVTMSPPSGSPLLWVAPLLLCL